jgi:hypothetical protein
MSAQVIPFRADRAVAVINAALELDPCNHMVRFVESARNAKSPIVGIPIPGERPFCVKGDLLKASLKGMRVTEASIQRPLPGMNGQPYLLVFAVNEKGNVRGSYKYYPASPSQFNHKPLLTVNKQWAEAQREKRSKPKLTSKAAKIEAVIRKLEKEKSPLWTAKNRIARAAPESADEYARTAWMRWHSEKPQRKALSKIAAMYGSGPDKFVYEALDKLFGTRVKRVSELKTHEREKAEVRAHGLLGYIRTPELFRLASYPQWGGYSYPQALTRKTWKTALAQREDDLKRAEARKDYLYRLSSDIRRAKEIDLQIADLRAMIEAETAKPVTVQ